MTSKKEDKNLDQQLKEIQGLLAEPGAKVLGELGHYLNFLSPFGKEGNTHDALVHRSSTKTQKHNNITWIDIENPTRREINQLTHEYPFHSLHLEDSLLKGQLPLLEKEEKYLFLLLNIPDYDPREDKVVANQVGIFIGKNYLITVHADRAPESRKLFTECEKNEEQRDAYFKKSSGYLLYNVIEGFLRDLSTLTQKIVQELDEIEDLVFDERVSDGYRIGKLRQKIIKLKRTIGPLRGVMSELTSNVNEFTGENLSRYYGNITKTINRLSEIVEEARETVEVYKDADFTASTGKTNQILALLTIIFTLTIPATVIGTFFGMNIPLPGGIAMGPWTFLGKYTTLILISAASLLPVLMMLRYFKNKNWF